MRKPRPSRARGWGVLAALTLSCLLSVPAAEPALAAESSNTREASLTIGGRTIHTFRAPLGMFTPTDRASAARMRIEQAFQANGEGWTSTQSTAMGVEVALDGNPIFLVVAGDARASEGESPEALAITASRSLRRAWTEAQERRDPRANIRALVTVSLVTLALAALLAIAVRGASRLRMRAITHVSTLVSAVQATQPAGRLAHLLPAAAGRAVIATGWVVVLILLFFYLTWALAQFSVTRPTSETLSESISGLALQALAATGEAVPGAFVAAFIFLLAWVATRVSTELFSGINTPPEQSGLLNTHNAPATRRIVNAAVWLFAFAMAYPYLPGSHTEAFKGLSVIVGLMASIGAAGVVGQIASGMMIIYTNVLRVGEYIRIQDHEGTVTDIGMFVTRLRTGMGEEVSLPNAWVLANVTRNFSRTIGGGSYVLDVTVTIGYDTPWRQVHALLLEAARSVPDILATPEPYVVQTALSDFYVAYKLVTHAGATSATTRARVASDLHAAIQDAFNRHGVQIMSPHYLGDPAQQKLVPQDRWHTPPALPGKTERES